MGGFRQGLEDGTAGKAEGNEELEMGEHKALKVESGSGLDEGNGYGRGCSNL